VTIVTVLSTFVASIAGGCVRVVVAAIMVRVVIVVVIVPNMDAIAPVLVAPLDLCLEMRPFAMLVALNGVIWVAPSVAELPGARMRNAGVPNVGGGMIFEGVSALKMGQPKSVRVVRGVGAATY